MSRHKDEFTVSRGALGWVVEEWTADGQPIVRSGYWPTKRLARLDMRRRRYNRLTGTDRPQRVQGGA
jgi:hypothetical protein